MDIKSDFAGHALETHNIARRGNEEFEANIENLVADGEAMRLRFMKRHRIRSYAAMTLGIISVCAGASGFGWFLFMDGDIARALGSMVLGLAVPAILFYWASAILETYRRQFKKLYLPKLAQTLGGFKFHPARGISRKFISKTGLIPEHDTYSAEDCFLGVYNGVKVMLSEARLYKKDLPHKPVFDGVFVLMELSQEVIEGHTILTADDDLFRKWYKTRWQKLQSVKVTTGNEEWDRFHILSSAPEAASLLIGERLLKELSEAADIFSKAPLSAAFFHKKFVFLMIPYAGNMFEASDVYLPLNAKHHARTLKREIEQILEIIDVFDLYKPAALKAAAAEKPSEGSH